MRLFLTLIGLVLFWSNSMVAQIHKCGNDEMAQMHIANHPEYQQELLELKNQVRTFQGQSASSRNILLKIPVVIHVIHSGEQVGSGSNLSIDRLISQIDILNEDFRRVNNDAIQTPAEFQDVAADAEIEFVLATVAPNGVSSNGITRHQYNNIPNRSFIENTIKPATQWNSLNYLNIWTVDMPDGSVLGYSYLPTNSIVGDDLDGVVVDYNKFGFVTSTNRGRTCTHEVGHFLGLSHIWGSNNGQGNPIGCSSDDGIADTPNSSSPYYNCPPNVSASCSSNDMSMNYMDYVDDHCMNMFTQGQVNVMRGILNTLRSELPIQDVSSTGCFDLDISPFDMGFESFEILTDWVIENANDDNRSWAITQEQNTNWGSRTGDGIAVYLWNNDGVTPADDYLFTPCFDLKEGHSYKISFAYACAEDNNQLYPEKLEVGFSDNQNSSTFNVLGPNWIFDPVNNAYPNFRVAEYTFDALGTSTVSLGFHVFSNPDQFAMLLDDILIEDLGISTSANEIEKEADIFNIYPNPATDFISIELNEEMQERVEQIQIMDALGREILLQNVSPASIHQFNISDYGKGIYFVSLLVEGNRFTQKLIITD